MQTPASDVKTHRLICMPGYNHLRRLLDIVMLSRKPGQPRDVKKRGSVKLSIFTRDKLEHLFLVLDSLETFAEILVLQEPGNAGQRLKVRTC